MTTRIELGKGDPPHDCNSKNRLPIDMKLCADARKSECPYYVKIIVNTEYLSFDQGFCGLDFKKEK